MCNIIGAIVLYVGWHASLLLNDTGESIDGSPRVFSSMEGFWAVRNKVDTLFDSDLQRAEVKRKGSDEDDR